MAAIAHPQVTPTLQAALQHFFPAVAITGAFCPEAAH
jgi:hypothetical protein